MILVEHQKRLLVRGKILRGNPEPASEHHQCEVVPDAFVNTSGHRYGCNFTPTVVRTAGNQRSLQWPETCVVTVISIHAEFFVLCPHHETTIAGVVVQTNIGAERDIGPVQRARHEFSATLVRVVIEYASA